MKRGISVLMALIAAVVIFGCNKETPVSPPISQSDEITAFSVMAKPNPFADLVRKHAATHLAPAKGVKLSGLDRLEGSFKPRRRGEPVPIPGGLAVPEEAVPGGIIHVFLPGPPELGLQGKRIEPGVIRDYSGFVAMAYLAGVAKGSDGKDYDQFHDIRVYRGKYRDVEGKVSHGTFVFI